MKIVKRRNNLESASSSIRLSGLSFRRKDAWGKLEIGLFVSGCSINSIAYQTFTPTILAVIFVIAGLGSLMILRSNGYYERKIFLRTFSVGWFMAGIAAVYANVLFDYSQIFSDAGNFYNLASRSGRGLSLEELRLITEGSGAVVLWRGIYDAFFTIGFEKARYIGVLVNVFAVAFTGVITIKMARQVYGEDAQRFQRLCFIFAWCGMFWLYSGIHLRDGVVLLTVSSLAHAWVVFLSRSGTGIRLFYFSIINLAAIAGLGYLRTEYAFVPVAMAICGMAAVMFAQKKHRSKFGTTLMIILPIFVLVSLVAVFSGQIMDVVLTGNDGYSRMSGSTSNEDSLALGLIVNQGFLVRLVIGSLYLFVFPIPFWSGFQLESAYLLFKSLNAIFFFFFTPLLFLAVWKLLKTNIARTNSLIFLLFCSLGFTFAISMTSLETRHWGTFFVPMFVLSLLPDLQSPRELSRYRKLCILFIGSIFFIHVLWIIVKFI